MEAMPSGCGRGWETLLVQRARSRRAAAPSGSTNRISRATRCRSSATEHWSASGSTASSTACATWNDRSANPAVRTWALAASR